MLTIHQPSSDICERFDDLILLSCGRMLYCGFWGDADSYFASAGFEYDLPPSSKPCLMPDGSCLPKQCTCACLSPTCQLLVHLNHPEG